MQRFSFDLLADQSLLRGARRLRARDRVTTALLVARIGEIDSRRLAERRGYPSTMAWCIAELRLSEDEAGRRIRAARFGRRYPQLFEALADGRLHLTAVNLIGPHLSKENFDDWIAAATHKTRAEIQTLIAIRRPRPDGPDGMVELADYVLEQVSDRVLPTAPQRHLFQCAIGEGVRAMLEEARDLMSHQNPCGKYEAILVEALLLLIPALKKRKFATSGTGARRMTAEVKEEVYERDGGRCTWVGETGRRCNSTWQVEFGHIIDVACGGDSSAGNIRCLCRAHNQLEAEQRFGAGFMEEKRRQAAEARRAGRQAAEARRAGHIQMKRESRAGAEESAMKCEESTRAGAVVKSTEPTRAGAGPVVATSPEGSRAGACSRDSDPGRELLPTITAA